MAYSCCADEARAGLLKPVLCPSIPTFVVRFSFSLRKPKILNAIGVDSGGNLAFILSSFSSSFSSSSEIL